MKKILLSVSALLCSSLFVLAQQTFPQAEINNILQQGFEQHKSFEHNLPVNQTNSNHLSPVLNVIDQLKKNPNHPTRVHNNDPLPQIMDTLIVGWTPNDTVIISGVWNHTGPIWVFGTGVLIFRNAIVHDTGDVYVFGNGKWIADSSSFFFPQNYFYERSFLVLQDASAHFGDCSMNYSGLSHSLVAANNANIDWQNVHQNDWTTCGLYGSPTITINHCNMSGEYVITDTATVNLNHADTIIIWHQLPASALINFTFPNANPVVYNYAFNNTVPGVAGINYSVNADSCQGVMWAIMPTNGSDVTISNSNLRLIGAWFNHGDITTVNSIINNSNYVNFTAPFADRTLQLNNTSVQTWSFYLFDSSQVAIDSCQLGEIGTQQSSIMSANNTIADGSGGYFWATDSSFTSATNSIPYSTCRSERKAMFLLSYSWMPFVAPTAIHNSNLICVQNELVADPVPLDGSVAWLSKIEGPDTASVNATFPITGSEWINQGPLGNPVDFASYSLYYQNPIVSPTWYPILINYPFEVSNNVLVNWNTNGLTPGIYLIKSVLKNNFNDSVIGLKVMVLLPNALSINELSIDHSSVSPNPFATETIFTCDQELLDGSLTIYNSIGETVRVMNNLSGKEMKIERADLPEGIYFIEVSDKGNLIAKKKIVVSR